MFLNDMEKWMKKNILGNNSKESLLNNNLVYWQNLLYGRCTRLFKWETGDFPSKELENALLMFGKAVVFKLDGNIVSARCTLYQNEVYFDEFKYATYTLPYITGDLEIGVNCVLANNTILRNPLLPLINHYANLLAHVDTSIIIELVNLRSTTSIIAKDRATATTADRWLTDLFNGKVNSIKDSIMENLTLQKDTRSNNNVGNLLEVRKELLNMFYQDIGIQSSTEKRERLNIPETGMNTGVLLINLGEMLELRKQCCEEVNAMFGTNWNVEKSVEYKQVEQSSTLDNNNGMEGNEDE